MRNKKKQIILGFIVGFSIFLISSHRAQAFSGGCSSGGMVDNLSGPDSQTINTPANFDTTVSQPGGSGAQSLEVTVYYGDGSQGATQTSSADNQLSVNYSH